MKKLNQRGITLIALVITIIVLLILAGVSIAMLTGQNGILTQAQKAKTTTDNKSAEEKVKLAVMAARSQSETGALEADKLVTEVTTNYGGQADTTAGGCPVAVAIAGKSFTVDENGTVEVSKYEPRIGIEVGDYVNYTPNVASTSYSLLGTQSGYDSDQTIDQESLKWRVLRKNADGSIDLIAANSTSKEVGFKGVLGYNNGVYLLNDICEKLYSNTGKNVKARSVNLDDMEKWLTPDGKNARANYSYAAVKYGETKTYTGGNAYRPDIYGKTGNENDKYYSAPTTNTYTPESGKATASDTLDAKQTYYEGLSTLHSAYYGDGAEVLSTFSFYWVAARYVQCESDRAIFGLYSAGIDMSRHSMFYSNITLGYMDFDSGSSRLRPVVSLGPDVKITPGKENNEHTIEW